jgi:hypothetical protein
MANETERAERGLSHKTPDFQGKYTDTDRAERL